jgi:AraC-like DNA-binding protein
MDRILLALRAPPLASLVAEAARLEGLGVSWERAGAPPEEVAAHAARGAPVVHDFQPDPVRSMAWLGVAARLQPRLTVFPLLATPASKVLTTLLQEPVPFRCAGVALVAEHTARELGRRLAGACELNRRRGLALDVAERWALDPLLAQLARRALSAPCPRVTLQSLLADAGVPRRAFVNRARAAGFDPPLRFFQSLRVVRVLARMQDGRTEREVALELGYGSTDTLRRQVRQLLRLTPSRARTLDLDDVVERLAGRIPARLSGNSTSTRTAAPVL